MIAADKKPLFKLKNKDFIVIKTIASPYNVPRRKTVTKFVDVRYEELKKHLINNLKEVDSYFLTCGNWTDVSYQSYLGVTIPYVSCEQTKLESRCWNFSAI